MDSKEWRSWRSRCRTGTSSGEDGALIWLFADLGFEEPEEELTKAQLASHIRQVIQRRRLTQVAAAALMGIDQPKVSALLNGRLANFSTDRLMRLLTTLGQDVEIVVKEKPTSLDKGRIRVSPCMREV